MITGELRSKIDKLWEEFWTGGIANPEWNKVWTENTPMHRFAMPDEMASCVLFLASDAASYVTGSVLVADGGYTTH